MASEIFDGGDADTSQRDQCSRHQKQPLVQAKAWLQRLSHKGMCIASGLFDTDHGVAAESSPADLVDDCSIIPWDPVAQYVAAAVQQPYRPQAVDSSAAPQRHQQFEQVTPHAALSPPAPPVWSADCLRPASAATVPEPPILDIPAAGSHAAPATVCSPALPGASTVTAAAGFGPASFQRHAELVARTASGAADVCPSSFQRHAVPSKPCLSRGARKGARRVSWTTNRVVVLSGLGPGERWKGPQIYVGHHIIDMPAAECSPFLPDDYCLSSSTAATAANGRFDIRITAAPPSASPASPSILSTVVGCVTQALSYVFLCTPSAPTQPTWFSWASWW